MNRIERQIELAVEVMRKLGIKARYIDRLIEKNAVYVFEDFGVFNINDYPTLQAKKQELEVTHKILVYAVIHNTIDGKESYSFLYIPNNRNNPDNIIHTVGKQAIVNAYIVGGINNLNGRFDCVIVKQGGAI